MAPQTVNVSKRPPKRPTEARTCAYCPQPIIGAYLSLPSTDGAYSVPVHAACYAAAIARTTRKN